MGQPTAWTPLGAIAPAELEMARRQAHHAAQWVTRAARANLPALPDDSHSNLGWDGARGGLFTHDLSADDGPVQLGLDIAELTIRLESPSGTLQALPLDGQRDELVGQWVGRMLREAGLSAARLHDPLPYEIEPCPIANGAPYDTAGNTAELHELAAYYDNAASLVGELVIENPDASRVRCWPHHFDLATLIALDEDAGQGDQEDSRTIGIGLSPGDETYGEPYFYVTPWPYPDASALPNVAELGHWHAEGYVAYVIRADDIVPLVADAQPKAVAASTEAALAACRQLLGNES